MENEIMYIKLDDIIPNRFQPREVFDDEALNKLAESIKQHGVIEPILVRPVDNKYEIVAGERRYKASVLAGLTKIPAMVRQLDDKESSIIAFIENEHRSDVSAIEEARTMDRILKSNNITQEELAKELGVNQSTIANKIRLLNLPLEVQESLMRNEISERHARSLLTVKDEEKQLELLKKIKEKRMTVRELDSEIKEMNNMNEEVNMNNNPVNSVAQDNSMFNEYLNNPPQEAKEETPPMATGFMDFLNNYDNSSPLQQPASNIVEPKEENKIDLPPVEETFSPINSTELEMPNYQDFADNLTEDVPPVAPSVSDNSYNDFLNNISTINESAPAGVNETEDPGFMEFLNNYDLNNPLPKDEPVTPSVETPTVVPESTQQVPETPVTSAPESNDFMDYLNSLQNSPLPTIETAPKDDNSLGNIGMDFLNTPPAVSEPVVPEVQPAFNENIYTNYTEPTNNVVINDVVPPITTDFTNQYIEDNPNYVDVSKQVVIDNVDDIINRLKVVIDDIKSSSKFKIDTDEINYDDIYQITIKIDKRDF